MTDQHTSDLLKEDIAKQIAAHLSISDFPADEQAMILAELGDVISDAVLEKVLERVPELERPEIIRLFYSADASALQELLERYIDDMSALVAEAAQEEIDAFVSEMKEGDQ